MQFRDKELCFILKSLFIYISGGQDSVHCLTVQLPAPRLLRSIPTALLLAVVRQINWLKTFLTSQS